MNIKAHSRWILYALASGWLITCIFLVFILHTSESLRANPQGTWILTHIVTPQEEASLGTIEYLLKRKASTHFDELVVMTSNDPELTKQLKTAGFYVVMIKAAELEQNLTSFKTPYFVLTSPRTEGVFAGQLAKPDDDVRLAQSFYSIRSVASFPASCGNSLRANQVFNPQVLIREAQSK